MTVNEVPATISEVTCSVRLFVDIVQVEVPATLSLHDPVGSTVNVGGNIIDKNPPATSLFVTLNDIL